MITDILERTLEPVLDTSLVREDEIAFIEKTIRERDEGQVEERLFRRFRLQNGIYGIRKQTDIQMVRVKIPYGRLTAAQLDALGDFAESYADGIGHVDTRQNVQFHWVNLYDVPDALRGLAEVGLTTREACGNVVRNVTGDPLAGVAPDEVFDVRPYADAVARFLLRHPVSQNLGRKFKIAFSGSQADRAFAGIHDIGGIATTREVDGQTARGFTLYVGGGLGSNPMLAEKLEDFTPVSRLLATALAIISVFNRCGNRDNPNRARLKFLVSGWGIEEFRRRVFDERDVLEHIAADSAFPVIDESDFDARQYGFDVNDSLPQFDEWAAIPDGPAKYKDWLLTNVVRQKQTGYYAAYVTLPSGDLTAEQWRGLAQIAREFTRGEAYTTNTQNMVFRWLPTEALPRFHARLDAIGLGAPGVHRIGNVLGCPGAATCNLAITTSHRLARALVDHFGGKPDYFMAEDISDVTVKISGCPNSCGHHHLASIGFFGASRRGEDGAVAPAYQLLLGGRVLSGSAVFGAVVAKVPARRVPQVIERLIELFRQDRQGAERFNDWVDRLLAANELKKVVRDGLADLMELRDIEDYMDWGETVQFEVEVNKGECAA